MDALERGDEWWERRPEKARGSLADPVPIDKAISFFQKALEEDPASLEAHWRLIRALFFRGEYAAVDIDEKKSFFESGKAAGENAMAVIRQTGTKKDRPKKEPVLELVRWVKHSTAIASCFLWSGVNWGKWAVTFGKLAAVRQGAGERIKDLATAAIELDPLLEDAGGYRLLGRLHFETPSIPFLTGWASHEEAILNLRKAVELGPRSLINKQYLAEALWEFEPGNRQEALALLKEVIGAKPASDLLIEERRSQEEARALLAAWKR
jgi:tetratricopeptide (TPR) repeat protein